MRKVFKMPDEETSCCSFVRKNKNCVIEYQVGETTVLTGDDAVDMSFDENIFDVGVPS